MRPATDDVPAGALPTTTTPGAHVTSTTSSPTPTAQPAPPDDARITLVLRVLTAAAFVVILNETLMMNALPPLMEVFAIDASVGQWLTTGFMLTMAVVIPMTGWLLQRVSIRTAFALAMGTFIVGTALCALAPSFSILLLGRVVQACGTAVMMPLLMTTIMTMVPADRRGRVMGNLTLAMSVAPALGPTVSGIILQFGSWRWLFGLVLPVAVLMTVAGVRLLRSSDPGRPARLDVLSVLLTALGFGGLVYGLSAFGKAAGGGAALNPVWTLVVGVVALALFVWRQVALQRRDQPFLDLRTLRHSRYAVALGLLCLSFMALIGAMLLLPIALQEVRGMSVLQSGLMLMPGALAMGLLGPTVGRLYDRVGPRPLVVPGAVVLVAAMATLALSVQHAPWWALVALHSVISVALAFLFTPVFTAGLGALPTRLSSHGSALLGASQQVAGAAGAALVVTVMQVTAATLARGGATEVAALGDGIRVALLVGAALAAGVVVLAIFVRRPEGEEHAGPRDTATPGAAEPDASAEAEHTAYPGA
ncbi:DHA2 family efflux MFS transporter permease subunit [Ornithinimicrobium sp. Y1847]|uniref:DHA2 family efflux MFS transporter permease subunit n=1 Tax=Ornithinimicrobium sp. Y1847 TaxID=3405419 RepID=UPI003B66F7B7